MEKYYDATIENKDRIHRVRNLAKCRSQAAMEDIKRQEEEVRRQVLSIAFRSI